MTGQTAREIRARLKELWGAHFDDLLRSFMEIAPYLENSGEQADWLVGDDSSLRAMFDEDSTERMVYDSELVSAMRVNFEGDAQIMNGVDQYTPTYRQARRMLVESPTYVYQVNMEACSNLEGARADRKSKHRRHPRDGSSYTGTRNPKDGEWDPLKGGKINPVVKN